MRFLLISALLLSFFHATVFAEELEVNKKIAECNQMVKDGVPEKALVMINQMLKKTSKSRDLILCKARAHMALEQFAEAVTSLTAVDQLSNTQNDRMMSLAMLGNAYKGNRQFDQAAISYQQSMDIAKAQKNKSFERIGFGLLGELQLLNQQYDEAILSYQSALKLALNDSERADAYEHIAKIYNQQQKHNQAIDFQLKATLAYTKYGDLDDKANAGLELGRIYMEAGEFEQAERTIKKINQMALDNGGAYWEVKSNLYLAKLKLATHQMESAKKLLEDAQKLNQEVGDSTLSESISMALSQLSK